MTIIHCLVYLVGGSQASSPRRAIYYFLLQAPVSSLFLNHTQPGPNSNNHSNHIIISCLHLPPRVSASHLLFITTIWGEQWFLKTNLRFLKSVIFKISPMYKIFGGTDIRIWPSKFGDSPTIWYLLITLYFLYHISCRWG